MKQILFVFLLISLTGCAAVQQMTKTCSTANVPYTDYQDLQYLVLEKSEASRTTGLNYYKNLNVKIQNTDTQGGVFEVIYKARTLKGEQIGAKSAYIAMGEATTITAIFDVDFGEDFIWEYEIKPAQKEVTRYRQEQQCK